MLFFVSLGICITLISSTYTTYHLFHVVNLDAHYRHLKSPKLWSWIAIGGQRGEGLILYLIKRQNYPKDPFSSRDALIFQQGKKKAMVGLFFSMIGAFLFLIGILFFT